MSDLWVTSDHHFGHRNIARYQGRPEEHEELMVEAWHSRVGADDPVLHLGDLVVFARGAEHGRYSGLMAALPGRKFLLRGNHDAMPEAWYRAAGFRLLGRRPVLWAPPDVPGLVLSLSHEPALDCGGWQLNVHGHVHGNAAAMRGRRLNVSVEVCGYGPVKLSRMLELCGYDGGDRDLRGVLDVWQSTSER